jgi:hypothetical protein
MVASSAILVGGEAVSAELEGLWIRLWAERKRCAWRADDLVA